jgi:SAM-dependent methyltransferase
MDTELLGFLQDNQNLWALKTPYHLNSDFYDRRSFLKGGSTLTELELLQVGEVKGLELLHLQCHFGLDTLSWVRLGARATGLDFSHEAIEAARALASESGLNCAFRCANVLDQQNDWESKFDRLVTSFGVLCWLANLDRWASNIAYYLRDGGVFSLLEFHPLTNLFSPEVSPTGRYSYSPMPVSRRRTGTYANRNAPIEYTEHVWGHNIGEIISSLMRAGLKILTVAEHRYSPIMFHPEMIETDCGWTIERNSEHLPVLLSITARK